MRFRKIRWDGRHVSLAWTEANGEDEIHSRLKSDDPPRKEFADQLQALASPARVLLELPGDYELTVLSVAIDRDKSGNTGVVVSATHAVEHANAPFVVHTPHVTEHEEMPQVVRTLISETEALAELATAYIAGQRSQVDMFEEEQAA